MYWTAGIGRFLLPEPSTTLGDARPSLGRQRTIKHWLGLFGHRSKSEKALASSEAVAIPPDAKLWAFALTGATSDDEDATGF